MMEAFWFLKKRKHNIILAHLDFNFVFSLFLLHYSKLLMNRVLRKASGRSIPEIDSHQKVFFSKISFNRANHPPK
jgi:Na+/phosphate symporter